MLVLNLVIIGLAISLEPIPFTAFALVLASAKGVRRAAAFIVGWVLSLATVVILTLVATANHPPQPSTAPSQAVLIVKILIGVAFLGAAARRRRMMGRPKKVKSPPKWQSSVDNMSAWFAVALGILTQPWGLVAAGVAIVIDAELSSWGSSLALLGFVLLSAGTYLAVEIYALVRPERTQAFLGATRAWVADHTDKVIMYIALVVGIWLIVDNLYLLVS